MATVVMHAVVSVDGYIADYKAGELAGERIVAVAAGDVGGTGSCPGARG